MKRSPLFPVFIFLPLLFLFSNAADEDAIARKKAADDYRASYVNTEISAPEQLGWTGKQMLCKPGKVSHDTYVKVLKRINYFRRLAGVPDNIVIDSSWNKLAQAAALIMFANNELNHNPTSSMKCYSEDGKKGAGTSNLSTIVDQSIKTLIADEIQDGGESNKECGHRRWLLNSKAYKMGFGATPGAYAVRVFKTYDDPDTSTYHGKATEYFGYPFQRFTPYQLVYPKWTFAVPGGDFTTAAVEVKVGDKILPAAIISRGKINYGDPTLVWVMRGLKEDFDYNYNSMPDKKAAFETLGYLNKKITVKISNVKVAGVMKSYSYSFTIFDPDEVN